MLQKTKVEGQLLKRALSSIGAMLKSDRVSKVFKIKLSCGKVILQAFSTFLYTAEIGQADSKFDGYECIVSYDRIHPLITEEDMSVDLEFFENSIIVRGKGWSAVMQITVGTILDIEASNRKKESIDFQALVSAVNHMLKLTEYRKDHPNYCTMTLFENEMYSMFPDCIVHYPVVSTINFKMDILFQKFLVEYGKTTSAIELFSTDEFIIFESFGESCVVSRVDFEMESLEFLNRKTQVAAVIASTALRNAIKQFPRTSITLQFQPEYCELVSIGSTAQLNKRIPCKTTVVSRFQVRQEYLMNLMTIMQNAVEFSFSKNILHLKCDRLHAVMTYV